MLTAKNITWRAARDGKRLLADVSFRVAAGELVVVLGPNGAGKSTLLRLLAGDHPLQEGEITWKGDPLKSFPLAEIARERAVLGQHNRIDLGFTVEEVVRMGRYPHFVDHPSKIDEEAVEQAMAKTHLASFRRRALDSTSGGEQQRTHIARTFTQVDAKDRGPRMLLLDEPLNDLDIRHQHALMGAARAFASEGNCVLAILHDVNLAAQYADRILLLNGGKIVADGRPEEVLTAPILTEAYGLVAQVMRHPCQECPLVYFGTHTLKFEEAGAFRT